MYISPPATVRAINHLKQTVHPFVGITFVACKQYGLTIGGTEDVSLDALTRAHLENHHRLDRGSSHYFQPFRGGAGDKWWVSPKYPSSGLQTVNTQTFPNVFLHSPNGKEWGFADSYLGQIVDRLRSLRYEPQASAVALAIWLYKAEDLGAISTYRELVDRFYDEYRITAAERSSLFNVDYHASHWLAPEVAFVAEPPSSSDVLTEFSAPPDAAVDIGSTITSLRLANAGLADVMEMEFGERLSIITGDNGLGKSFLLDFAWWAATGAWADREAVPLPQLANTTSSVTFALRGASGRLSNFTATYDHVGLSWNRPPRAMTLEALAVFSRADGSFAISDPLTKRFARGARGSGSLTSNEVWNGRPGVIEGLIRDWVKWSQATDKLAFDRLKAILRRLSPEDMGPLSPGPLVRLPGDNRDIPTVSHNYGYVPVTQASSGVQRVLLLAYLIIWSWQEHEKSATDAKRSPLRRMLVIVDELEAHLHPKWQRIVLPALMRIGELLGSELAIQTIAATHSPMILASMESSFRPQTDLLYHLYGDGKRVRLEETPFVKYGDASGWLTSPLFGLLHARSADAEKAIEDAKSLQLSEAVATDEVREVSERLRLYLPDDDKFWPRWLYFAEQHGVVI